MNAPWMVDGSSGAPGQAVPRHVVGGPNRDRGCATDHSLVERFVQEIVRKYAVAMRRDARV